MKHLAALVGLLALGGCAAFGPNVQVMSPDQLAQYAKDNKASGACNITLGAGWTSKTSFATADEDKSTGSTISINPDNCGLSISTTPRPPAVRQCAAVSWERNPDGACYRIERDASCNTRGSFAVPCPQ